MKHTTLLHSELKPEQSATPEEAVQEMLSQYSEEAFKSSTTTFLEPCFGQGTFIKGIIEKLESYGHSKENIESRIMGIEISTMLFNKTRRKLKDYNINLVKADALTYNFDTMKFDYVIGNIPFTIGGNEKGKGAKSAIPAFVELGMRVGKAVKYILPAHFATYHAVAMTPKWAKLRTLMESFGLQNIQAIDQKKFFPDVDFLNAAVLSLEEGSTNKVEDYEHLFGGFAKPDTTDAPRISTQRGISISKDSPELSDQGAYKVLTQMSNDGSNTLNYKFIDRPLTTVKSPWCVCIQEQSALGINDAIVVDNTADNVVVSANVYPLHCQTREEAEKLAVWVTSEEFNNLLRKANSGGDRIHRVFLLQLLPKYKI